MCIETTKPNSSPLLDSPAQREQQQQQQQQQSSSSCEQQQQEEDHEKGELKDKKSDEASWHTQQGEGKGCGGCAFCVPLTQEEKKALFASRATFTQCVFNMANILMGAGLLGLPYAMKSAGAVGGILGLAVLGLLTWRTSILIGREMNGDARPASYFDEDPHMYKSKLLILAPSSASDLAAAAAAGDGSGSTKTAACSVASCPHAARMRAPLRSFQDIAKEAFGNRGKFFLSIVLYFELFSCLCIFLVSIADHLRVLFPKTLTRGDRIVTVSMLTVVPTLVLHSPRLLSYLSMVGTLSTVAVVMAVVGAAVVEGDLSDKVPTEYESYEEYYEAEVEGEAISHHTLWRTSGLPLSMGLAAYCFSGHAIVPSIYNSMQRPQDFERMINVSYFIVTAACLLVGLSGYYMFGDTVKDQVTLSLEKYSSAAVLMKNLTWLTILTSFSKYILTMHPLALGMEEIIAPCLKNDFFIQWASPLIKLFVCNVALLVSVCIPSFNFICALVGMICTMTVSVIFPAAAHLKLFETKISVWETVLDWFFVIFGCIMAVVGTIACLYADIQA